IHGPGSTPIAEVAADGTTHWLHADELGSVRAITDGQGTVVGTSTFDAYGAPTDRTGSVTSRIGFQGNYMEAGSGLQYLLARVYDPGTGQFLTVDPAVLTTKQPYAFAASDPSTYRDPTGLDVTLSGHGDWQVQNGYTTVPEGTTVVFHTPAGWAMTDQLGNAVERTGTSRYEERYGPGSIIPNYFLHPPMDLTVEPTSRTVNASTGLGKLLAPNQGEVHWAACRLLSSNREERRRLGDPGSASYDRWVGDHVRGQRVRRSDQSDGVGGWGIRSVPVFGDSQRGKDPDRTGPYRDEADPIIFMPGV
ncbi:MAG: RHS repeat-associated core domain-containing protein, partial [Chloroflexi bacterium]|nr:RHS repeat-associated core domain-containing protein [Chloroflexota bacterium]